MWNKNWKVKQNLAKLMMTTTSSGNYTIAQEQCWFIKPDNSRIKSIRWEDTGNRDICYGGFLSCYLDSTLITGKVTLANSDIGGNCKTDSFTAGLGWLLHVGSGTDTPTENDFNLKSAYSYGVDVEQIEASASKTYNENTRVVRKTINSVMRARKDMTINEIGLSAGVNDISKNIRILFAREVLATPLTVTQGQTFQVSLSFEQTLDDIVDVPPVVSANVQALNDEPGVLNDDEVLNDEMIVL